MILKISQMSGDLLLVSVLSVVIYLNVLKGEFVFDDLVAIVDNTDVKPDQPLEEVFRHDFWGQKMEDWQSHKSFRPLTILSFRLSYILSGERWDEVHFHLTNVFLHAVVSMLVLPVAYRCFGPERRLAALSSALFFATHPIHTDAVSSIVSRGEQLSGMFLLLSFLAYAHAADRSRGVVATLVCVPLSVGLGFVGMLCKEQAITVVAIQAAYDIGTVSPLLYASQLLTVVLMGLASRSGIGVLFRRKPQSEAELSADNAMPSETDAAKENEEAVDGERDSSVGVCDAQSGAQSGDERQSELQEQNENVREEINDGTQRREGGEQDEAWARFGGYQAFLLVLRLAILCVGFGCMYSWRMGLNGECITVYKTKGDPLISAWDAAGTVAPGVYSESACRPNFLQVENPARFIKGDGAVWTKTMTWHFCAAYNAYLMLIPTTLRADYSHDTVPLIEHPQDPRNCATALFWLLLLVVVVAGFVTACGPTRDCAILLSVAFMVVPFVPSSNLFFPVGFVIAERVLYMPSLGFCMLLALLAEKVDNSFAKVDGQKSTLDPPESPACSEDVPTAMSGLTAGRKGVRAAVVIVVVLYSVRTWIRNYDWVSREGFYGAMIRDNPTNPKAHYGYGNIVINDVKRTDIGEQHLLEASRLQPNYFDAYNDLGAWYSRNGEFEKAKKQFEFAVGAKPEHINGLTNQGLNFLGMRDYENAFMVFDKAVEYFPDSVDFYNNMGIALQGLGMHEDALQAYSDIIVLDPVSPRSYYLYAIAAGQMGRSEEAEVYFRNALRIRPWYVDALYNLGVCLMQQERMEEAYAYFLRVHYVNHKHPGLERYLQMLRGE